MMAGLTPRGSHSNSEFADVALLALSFHVPITQIMFPCIPSYSKCIEISCVELDRDGNTGAADNALDPFVAILLERLGI